MPTFRRRCTLAGSVAIAAAIVGLSVAALAPRASSGPWPSLLVTLVLLGLGFAISLHVRFLLRVRRAHGETARVLEAGGREVESIFGSPLAAIFVPVYR